MKRWRPAVLLLVLLASACGGAPEQRAFTGDREDRGTPPVTAVTATVDRASGRREPSSPARRRAGALSASLELDPLRLRPTRGTACRAGASYSVRTARVAYTAFVRRRAVVYRARGGPVLARFERLNQNGVSTAFGILGVLPASGCKPSWYRVQAPVKPNGSTGYVRADEVFLYRVDTRIEVDLSKRRVTLFRRGRRVLSSRAAIGSSSTPTPLGSFYVNQKLIPTDSGGPFGPGAVGISSFSEVLTGWAQGGPIALHGTNRPELIGAAVSNGCIRLPNPILRRLFAAVYPGTPVLVHA